MAGAGPLLTPLQMSVFPAGQNKAVQAKAAARRELTEKKPFMVQASCSATLLQRAVEAGQDICKKIF